MIIQATSHGTAAAEEPFAFTYSGDFTDNRVDGVGTVRLNTSGTLTVTGSPVTVSVTIVGAGGGAARRKVTNNYATSGSGGGGGIQTVEVTLEAGTYDIVIGTGGAATNKTGSADQTGGTGGSTIAFGKTSTGGGGGTSTASAGKAGSGGTPNGKAGKTTALVLDNQANIAGGTPNGGAVVNGVPQAGGDGYVDLTFS